MASGMNPKLPMEVIKLPPPAKLATGDQKVQEDSNIFMALLEGQPPINLVSTLSGEKKA